MEKYGTAKQAINDHITGLMRFACLMSKTRIQIQTQNVEYLLLFYDNSSYAKAPHLYVIGALPLLQNFRGPSGKISKCYFKLGLVCFLYVISNSLSLNFIEPSH